MLDLYVGSLCWTLVLALMLAFVLAFMLGLRAGLRAGLHAGLRAGLHAAFVLPSCCLRAAFVLAFAAPQAGSSSWTSMPDLDDVRLRV